ncbi:MAG: N-acetylmuramoyl-L-alanine amidase [Candidatus Coprenecus sp.]|nr:N-acetylmuramoyl-L-alanine amidase [Candidatus Coprenecus sp.]
MMKKIYKIGFLAILAIILFPIQLHAQQSRMLELGTVVIDAGHGGKDPGAISGSVKEKDITLSVAKRLGALINEKYPNVKIIYTRSGDTFVELKKRAEIANKNNADLFISIHVNSAKNRLANGSETFVMGSEKSSSNFEVCQLENSVITLEEDYSSNYSGFDPSNPESYIIFSLLQNSHLEQSLMFAQLVQNNAAKGPIAYGRGVKQANFLVLWMCTMPAVLVELGFISNKNDFQILSNKKHQQKMAENIFNAFCKYKKNYDKEYILPASESVESKEQAGVKEDRFGIQIFVSSKSLPKGSSKFKGYDCNFIKTSKGLYKYYIGGFSSKEEAAKKLPAVRKSFPDAFIIEL